MNRLAVDRGGGQAGFTLVEALLALVLMSIILLALATVTGQWLPGWDRGFVRVQSSQRLAAGLDRLAIDLASAEAVSAGTGEGSPLFDGGEREVIFVRTAIGPNAAPGLEVVRIAEAQVDGMLALVRTTTPFLPEIGRVDLPLEFSHPVVLLRAPFRVAFAFAGPQGKWQESWRREKALPRAVRIEVRDRADVKLLSTSAVVGAEVPARCATAKTWGDCVAVAGKAR